MLLVLWARCAAALYGSIGRVPHKYIVDSVCWIFELNYIISFLQIVIWGETIMFWSCRCCSRAEWQVKTSLAVKTSETPAGAHWCLLLRVLVFFIIILVISCALETLSYQRRDGLPLICGLQVTAPELICKLAPSVMLHVHIQVKLGWFPPGYFLL